MATRRSYVPTTCVHAAPAVSAVEAPVRSGDVRGRCTRGQVHVVHYQACGWKRREKPWLKTNRSLVSPLHIIRSMFFWDLVPFADCVVAVEGEKENCSFVLKAGKGVRRGPCSSSPLVSNLFDVLLISALLFANDASDVLGLSPPASTDGACPTSPPPFPIPLAPLPRFLLAALYVWLVSLIH